MLKESQQVDQVMVDQNKIVHIRESIIALRDDVEIARTYHRTTLTQGQDVSAWPENVQAICQAAWAT